MIKPEDVTIIIPHLGASKESEYALDECVDSLLSNSPSEIQILVVCNGNSGVCNHRLKIPYSVVLLQQGQCKAVNATVATTNTPYILVTNDDMIYPPGWFEKLTEFVGEDFPKRPLCISPKLIEPNDGAPTFQKYFCGGAGGDFDKQKFLDFVKNYEGESWRTGFNLPFLISRELWDTVGGYDINYDPWSSNSDSDLEYKIKLAGVQPLQQTNSIVYHFSQTSGTFHPDHRDAWQRNWEYFIKKWGFERIGSPEIWTATFEIPEDKLTYRPEWKGKYR